MKLFEKGELKLLWPFYLEYFTASLFYFAPAFMILFLLNIGLSLTKVGILIAIMPLTALIFEIPTGAVADLYGRKFSVLLGYLIEGLCMLSVFFFKSYIILLGIFAIWGIGTTFSSGSKDAWIVDFINKKKKNLVHNFFNKMQIFISFGLIFSGIIGAIAVSHFGVNIIWLVGSFSYLFSIVLLFFFTKEDYPNKKMEKKGLLKDVIFQSKITISYGYKHHVLFYYLFATLLLAFVGSLSSSITWTSFLRGFEFPDSYFGYMWSIIGFFSMIAPIASSKLLKKGKEKEFIILSFIISAVILFFVLFSKNWAYALVILALSTLSFGIGKPALEVLFHRFIPNKMRATMGSVRSMIIYIGGIIGTASVGYIIDLIGAKYTLLLYVPLVIPIIILYLKIKETPKPKK